MHSCKGLEGTCQNNHPLLPLMRCAAIACGPRGFAHEPKAAAAEHHGKAAAGDEFAQPPCGFGLYGIGAEG